MKARENKIYSLKSSLIDKKKKIEKKGFNFKYFFVNRKYQHII